MRPLSRLYGMNIWEDWGFFATIFDGMLVPIPIELQEDI